MDRYYTKEQVVSAVLYTLAGAVFILGALILLVLTGETAKRLIVAAAILGAGILGIANVYWLIKNWRVFTE